LARAPAVGALSWGCERRLMRTAASHWQSWCWVRLWCCPAIHRTQGSRRRHWAVVQVWPTPRHIPTRPLPPAAAGEGLPAALQRCQEVYIRKGGTVSPLAALYAGPYQVVERRPKTFTVLVGDKSEVVSVDQLKPDMGQGRSSRRHRKLPTLLLRDTGSG